MRVLARALIVVLACFCASCLYDSAFDVSCDSEGARDGDRVCMNGTWVASVSDVGPDQNTADGSTPGMDAAADSGDMGGDTPCESESNVDFCGRLGFDCEEVTAADNCGDERTINCGMCTAPQTCGAESPNVCGCIAEDDPTFCTRLVKTCDDVTDADNCGDDRTVNCGACTAPATCGGGGTANVCACPDQTDIEFCASYSAACGALTDVDECGQMRTTDCGACTGPETCGSVDANQCDCPDDAAVCTALLLECGPRDVTAMCNNKTSIDCGGCQLNATCDAANLCMCDMGFSPDGLGNCEDIDECALGTDNCDAANATCTNSAGGFTCMCNNGYTGNGVTCMDIDECTTNADNCDPTNATCTNLPGTFSCMCDAGFSGNGVTCADIDECALNTDNCAPNTATCTNTPGSFTCMCNSGYAGNGRNCADVDECATNADDCDPVNGICTNAPGTFSCMCADGFVGDGVTCVPITLTVSIQRVEITMAGGSLSGSAPLPTAIDAANAVPFVTTRSTAAEIDDTAVDVVLTDTDVQVTRSDIASTTIVFVGVVEFDPTRVRVQQGTFVNEGDVTLPMAVAQTASFMTFAAEMTHGNDEVDNRMLSGSFADSTTLNFDRQQTPGEMAGHYYVAEALDGGFTVQHLTGSIMDGDGSTTLPVTAVNLAESFVLYSYQSTETGTDLSDGVVSCALTDSTTVTCSRSSSSQDITDLHVQVIEVPGATVQRGATSRSGSGDVDTVNITAVDLSQAIMNLGQTGSNGLCQTDETSNNGYPTAAFTAAFNSTSEVEIRRSNSGDGEATCTWEAIEWPP